MRDKYSVIADRYCYSNSDVLKNELNIQNFSLLKEAETAFTAHRYSQYTSPVTSIGHFTFTHLKYLHWYLFQDVYSWAGEIRTVDIAKGTTRFCTCHRIDTEAHKQFSRIPLLLHLDSNDKLLLELADIFCEINVVHPFREGNGRAQRFLFEELFFFLGLEAHWPDLSQDEWVQANIAGFNGDNHLLHNIITKTVSRH